MNILYISIRMAFMPFFKYHRSIIGFSQINLSKIYLIIKINHITHLTKAKIIRFFLNGINSISIDVVVKNNID